MKMIARLSFLALLAALVIVPSFAERAEDAPSGDAEMRQGGNTPETGSDAAIEGCPFRDRGETSSKCPAQDSDGDVRACPFSGKADAKSQCPHQDGSVHQAVGTYRT